MSKGGDKVLLQPLKCAYKTCRHVKMTTLDVVKILTKYEKISSKEFTYIYA